MNRMRTVEVNGERYEIPAMWLVGRAQSRGREGMKPIAAEHAAILDWVEQENLHRQFLAERSA